MARERGIRRLIFASSCSLYGASEGVLDEQSPLDPLSVYARSKMKSEELLLASADTDFAPVVLRFGTFYGLSPRPRFDIVVNLLVAKAVTEGKRVVLVTCTGCADGGEALSKDEYIARLNAACEDFAEDRSLRAYSTVGTRGDAEALWDEVAAVLAAEGAEPPA